MSVPLRGGSTYNTSSSSTLHARNIDLQVTVGSYVRAFAGLPPEEEKDLRWGALAEALVADVEEWTQLNNEKIRALVVER